MNNNINAKIGKATLWSSVTEVIAKLISPIVNMVLARLLAPEAFGVVATITMVISFAELFTDAGFQKYIVQHEFGSREELDDNTNVAFWTNLTFSVLICGIITVFRHDIARLVGSNGLGNAIALSSLLIIIAAFSSLQIARYRRDLDFKTMFYARMSASLMPIVVTVPLAVWLRDYRALIIGNFASQLITAVILTAKSKWKPRLFFRLSILKEMFSFSAWTLLESIAIWLTSYIGVFIVGSQLSDYYLGIYKTSMSTVNSYMALVTSSITPVLFSALSRYQNDDENFKKTYYSFQKYCSLLVIPMGIGIYLYSDLVTLILLGSQWTEASGFVGLWGLSGALIIVFSHFASEVYRSKGNPKLSLLSQLIHLAFVVPTLIIAVNYSFSTLYIARSLVRLQGVLGAVIIMRVVYKFHLTDIVKNVYPSVICGVIMGIFGYFVKDIFPYVWWQLLTVAMCVAVYFALLFICFPKLRREVLSVPVVAKVLSRLKDKLIKR